MKRPDVLLLTGKDPWAEPTGGTATFASHLVRVYRSRLAVASTCQDFFPVGQWTSRMMQGDEIQFFNLGRLHVRNGRLPLIPARLQLYYLARRHSKRLYQSAPDNILIDSPELLFAAVTHKWHSLCYCFAGVSNPVSHSRYRWARVLGGFLDRKIADALRRAHADAVLAAADSEAIKELFVRTNYAFDEDRFYPFPTRVDTTTFYPEPALTARRQLGIAEDTVLLVAIGRLSWVKGWDLLLSAFEILRQTIPATNLIFVGDGEDRHKIESFCAARGMQRCVRITGFVSHDRVRTHLNAANVGVVASHREGWSLAMLEMLACGKPIVSTGVSGAKSMIRQGQNGFVVNSRHPEEYAVAVKRALQLTLAPAISREIAEQYSVQKLKSDLGRIWRPLAS